MAKTRKIIQSPREKTREDHRKFISKVQSHLHGAESAFTLLMKGDKLETVIYDPKDLTSEMFFSLAQQPEFYAMFKLAIHLTDNPVGEELYDETVKQYNLLEDERDKDK